MSELINMKTIVTLFCLQEGNLVGKKNQCNGTFTLFSTRWQPFTIASSPLSVTSRALSKIETL